MSTSTAASTIGLLTEGADPPPPPGPEGPRCPSCDVWHQKYLRLRQSAGTQRRWAHDHRDLLQTWDGARRQHSHGLALEARAEGLRQQLAQATRASEAQATRIMELELLVKRLEAKARHPLRDGADAPVDRSPRCGATPTHREMIHEFEQQQSILLQHLRQRAGALDPYDDAPEARGTGGGGRQAADHLSRREPAALCSGQCVRYLDQLAGEVDACRRSILEYQSMLQEQQRKHCVTVRAVNEKYRELKQVNSLMQQRVSGLVYQLQAVTHARAVGGSGGVPWSPSPSSSSSAAAAALGPAAAASDRTPATRHPQHNYA